MDPRLLELLEVIIVFGCGTGVISLWLWLRHSGRRALRRGDLERLEGQLRELQQSIDAISVEVERISEGQRFTTKLLSGRPAEGASVPGAPERVVP